MTGQQQKTKTTKQRQKNNNNNNLFLLRGRYRRYDPESVKAQATVVYISLFIYYDL